METVPSEVLGLGVPDLPLLERLDAIMGLGTPRELLGIPVPWRLEANGRVHGFEFCYGRPSDEVFAENRKLPVADWITYPATTEVTASVFSWDPGQLCTLCASYTLSSNVGEYCFGLGIFAAYEELAEPLPADPFKLLSESRLLGFRAMGLSVLSGSVLTEHHERIQRMMADRAARMRRAFDAPETGDLLVQMAASELLGADSAHVLDLGWASMVIRGRVHVGIAKLLDSLVEHFKVAQQGDPDDDWVLSGMHTPDPVEYLVQAPNVVLDWLRRNVGYRKVLGESPELLHPDPMVADTAWRLWEPGSTGPYATLQGAALAAAQL